MGCSTSKSGTIFGLVILDGIMLLWNIFVTWNPKMTDMASSVNLSIISNWCFWNYFSEILNHKNVNSNIHSSLCDSFGLPNLQRITQSGFVFEKECKTQIAAFCSKEEDTYYPSYRKNKWYHQVLSDVNWDWLCIGYKKKTWWEIEFRKLQYFFQKGGKCSKICEDWHVPHVLAGTFHEFLYPDMERLLFSNNKFCLHSLATF